MKTPSLFASILLISVSFSSCNQKSDCEGGQNGNCVCYEIYAPVCGCDGVTYDNDCFAECAGVTDYSIGSCN